MHKILRLLLVEHQRVANQVEQVQAPLADELFRASATAPFSTLRLTILTIFPTHHIVALDGFPSTDDAFLHHLTTCSASCY